MPGPDSGIDPPIRGIPPRPVRVFLSHSRETDDPQHLDRVLELANDLRRDGVDARVDLYETSPAEGWAQWARRELDLAEFVLAVCTAAYRVRFAGDDPAASDRAVRWEAQLLRQRLYEDASFGARVIPVLLAGSTPDCVPDELRGQTAYRLPADRDDLYRHLTDQPGVVRPPLGELRARPDNLPSTPPDFVGRTGELADITAALARGGPAALVQAISGLGGVGKTRLALEYAHRHARDYDVRWWLRAASLEEDLVELGRRLGVLTRPDDVERSTPEILAWLRNHRRWLLVVDNADDPAALRDRLPLPAAGHVLITSRTRAWRGVATPLELQTLPHDVAVDLLVRRSGRADDGHVGAVARALGDLPLALVQAAAFVEQTGCTFVEYLQRLRDEGIDLLRDDLGRTGDYYRETVATTWKLNFDAVRREHTAAADLLDFLAFLDPDGVPLALLREQPAHLPGPVAALVASPRALDQALALLRRFSLVEREDGVLRVHRLVQAVARDALAPEPRNTLAKAAVAWARAVFSYDPEDPQVGRITTRIVEQILALSELAECVESAGSGLVPALGDLSHYLTLTSQGTRAREAAIRATMVAEALAVDPTNAWAQRDLSVSLDRLGDVEMQAGNLAAARPHYDRGLKVREALAAADLTSARAQRDLSISSKGSEMWKCRPATSPPHARTMTVGSRSARRWRRST
jgi:hypothetical protein